MFQLAVSMKKLADTTPLKSLRFWGKINGVEKDYLIVEGEFKEGEGKEGLYFPSYRCLIGWFRHPQNLRSRNYPRKKNLQSPSPSTLQTRMANLKWRPKKDVCSLRRSRVGLMVPLPPAAAPEPPAAAAPASHERDPDEPATPRPQVLEGVTEIPKEEREEPNSPNQYTYWVTSRGLLCGVAAYCRFVVAFSRLPTISRRCTASSATLFSVWVLPTPLIRPDCDHSVFPLVCPAGDPWIRLPQVTPAQIVAARSLKRLFTGNLGTIVWATSLRSPHPTALKPIYLTFPRGCHVLACRLVVPTPDLLFSRPNGSSTSLEPPS